MGDDGCCCAAAEDAVSDVGTHVCTFGDCLALEDGQTLTESENRVSSALLLVKSITTSAHIHQKYMENISRIHTCTMSGWIVGDSRYLLYFCRSCEVVCRFVRQNYIKQTYGRCKPPSTLLQLKGYYFVLFSPPPDKATPHYQSCYRSVAERTRSVCEYVCMYVCVLV